MLKVLIVQGEEELAAESQQRKMTFAAISLFKSNKGLLTTLERRGTIQCRSSEEIMPATHQCVMSSAVNPSLC